MTTALTGPLDLDQCAREPIHLITSIQSHGVLIAVSEPDFIVRQVSTNIEQLVGAPAQTVLGQSLEVVLGAEQFEVFLARLRSDDLSSGSALPVVIGPRAIRLNCIAHRQDGALIVEFEFADGLHALDAAELTSSIQLMLSRMERGTTILDYVEVAASEIGRVTGFDRVMVYRFDPEWNGEIIAECIGNDILEPVGRSLAYLGLYFPASDIPAQARALFLLNPVRAIADLDSAPVPIVPEIGPLTGRPLDMSHTFLRSASPVHVEYLHNMGVRASLAISIVVDGELWGMIACHHHTPRPIDCLTRSVCELIARNLSLQVTLRMSNALWHARQAARKLVDEYVERLETRDERVDGASLHDALFLDLLDADALISRINGAVTSHGATIPPDALPAITGKLQSLAARGVSSCDKLELLHPTAAAFAHECSGALYIDLGRRSGDYLLFVRGEFVRTVNWAGNPDKAAMADGDGKLHPRTSFAAWQDTVRGRARPWTVLEIDSASFIREQLIHIRNAERLRELEALEAESESF